jgi:hypothetical protein
MVDIKVDKRRAVFAELRPYCMLSGEGDYIEVTQWANGEGYDIEIETKKRRERFSLTYGEWELLQVLMNYKES